MSRFHSDSLRRVVRVAFVIASIVSCELEAFARPGGGRGPGGPGGDRPGAGAGMRPGPRGPGGPGAAGPGTIGPRAAGPGANSLQASLAGRTQPFTAAWYAEHPNAWRYAHPYADWWAVAGVAGLSSWLGYSVASEGATQAHVYQQLAVSRKGELKGNSYDAISNATQPISGKIDAETRKATWTVGASGGATFETTLDALMKTPSGVTMKTGSAVQEWELVQMEKPEPKPTGP